MSHIRFKYARICAKGRSRSKSNIRNVVPRQVWLERGKRGATVQGGSKEGTFGFGIMSEIDCTMDSRLTKVTKESRQ